MHDPNRLMKWLSVIALVVISLVVLYPPNEKLKGGIDLVGGTSLLFEIDTTDLAVGEQRELSTRVMRILKERVDPKGQLNLEWRPVGSTRLEIRMPRPPKEALARRETYNRAFDHLQAMNLKRREVEEALNTKGAERPALLDTLKRGVTERTSLIEGLSSAFDASVATQPAGENAETQKASETYEQAMTALLATSLPIHRLSDVLALPEGEKRTSELEKLRTEFPSYDAGSAKDADGKLLTRAIAAYDAWSANKANLEDPSDLKRRLRGAGVLEFRILADRDPSSPANTFDPLNPQLKQPISRYSEQLAKYGARPKAGDRFRWFPIEDVLRFTNAGNMTEFEAKRTAPGQPIIEEYAGRYYVLMHSDPEYSLLQTPGRSKSWELRKAYPDRNPMTGENVVSFQLDARGGRLFGELTGKNVNRQLCIMLDQQAVSHANIRERITERCQISGQFTPDKVNDLVGTLEAGSLPARLKETPLREQTIGPSLGETNRRNGMRASIWGGILVAVFVLFYYGFAGGGVANLALALNVLFVLGIMATMQATFTLPGIAGLILTVGMAIDANVLIFERIREERARGVIFKKALNAGYDKAFSAIFDSNLTTLITCVILAFVGTEEVRGFGITLGLGLATSMFTALFCTRLAFNSLIAKGWLTDLSMRRLIEVPSIDWVGLRRIFLPLSGVAVSASLALFIGMSIKHTEEMYDIEFLGGTSVQIDLKPESRMTDDAVRKAITETQVGTGPSAVQWLVNAADQLAQAKAADGEVAGQFTLTSTTLSGDQLAVLMHKGIEPKLERGGITTSGSTATFAARSGQLTLETFKAAVAQAADDARKAADQLRGAKVQTVGDGNADENAISSFEVVTVETNRQLVQEAILAVLGEKLSVERAIRFTPTRDEEVTKEPFFVIEAEDQYLSDVLATDAQFDLRRFRGGVAVEVALDAQEEPIPIATLEQRLREVGLQPEFEHHRTRETGVLPLGAATPRPDGSAGYKRFAICAVDESLLYDEDPAQWRDGLAVNVLAQVTAALESEKSLSKVVQFAPQIAGQTTQKAVFAMVLAMGAIAIYVWMRFGNRDFGFAVLVALVHDVAIVLGMVAFSHFVHETTLAKALLFEDFKIDLPMVAAILTVIGYSLNDTIVVFDRIRENRGRMGSLSAHMINDSINQTMSRTVLTSLTVFLVVVVLYAFGGKGVHGFSVALLIGVISGTYSTLGIAVPLVYRPKLLSNVVLVLVSLGLVGLVFAFVENATARLILGGLIVLGGAWGLVRSGRTTVYVPAGQPA